MKKEYIYEEYDCEDDFITDLIVNDALDLSLLDDVEWDKYEEEDRGNVFALGVQDICSITKETITIIL